MAPSGEDTSPGEGASPGTPSPLAPDSISPLSTDDNATCAIDESFRQYPFHYNRRYHKYKEGSYPFPNDDQEQERMDTQFVLIKQAQGNRLFFAPVQDARNVLDVGTGTGIWCVTLADSAMFPNATITGIDLSPIQDEDSVPENVYFFMEDCSEPEWPRPLGSLDFIYTQSLLGSLQDYAQYLITARKYLVPGSGWIECCETDPKPFCDDGSMPGPESESEDDDDEEASFGRNTLRNPQQKVKHGSKSPGDYAYKRWAEWMDYATKLQGRPLRIAKKVRKWMIAAGYVDVHVTTTKIPIGSWPKRKDLKVIGKKWATLIADSLPAASYKTFSEALGWSRDQIEVFLVDVRQSLANRDVHAYLMNYTVCGRRPSADEEKAMGRMAPPPAPAPRARRPENQQSAVT